MVEPLVTHRLRRLAPQRTDLPPHLPDHVRHAREVRVGQRQLLHGLAPRRLVFRDARRLFKHRAPLLRLRRQDLIDLALRHDRITGPADASVHEKFLDVLQPARLAVERIFALPVAVHPAHNLHLVKFRPELLFAFREQQRHFADLRRLARVRALENHVLHLAAAQGLRALFPQHPANRVGDVGLAAAVGPDDRGHAGFEAEGRVVGKGFESVKLERLEIHAVGNGQLKGAPCPPQRKNRKVSLPPPAPATVRPRAPNRVAAPALCPLPGMPRAHSPRPPLRPLPPRPAARASRLCRTDPHI